MYNSILNLKQPYLEQTKQKQQPLTLNRLNQDLWTKEDEKRLFPASPYEVAPITNRSKVS